jgi:hypothetical protein
MVSKKLCCLFLFIVAVSNGLDVQGKSRTGGEAREKRGDGKAKVAWYCNVTLQIGESGVSQLANDLLHKQMQKLGIEDLATSVMM